MLWLIPSVVCFSTTKNCLQDITELMNVRKVQKICTAKEIKCEGRTMGCTLSNAYVSNKQTHIGSNWAMENTVRSTTLSSNNPKWLVRTENPQECNAFTEKKRKWALTVVESPLNVRDNLLDFNAHTCKHTHMHTHTHTRAHTHARTHTYTHTHTL